MRVWRVRMSENGRWMSAKVMLVAALQMSATLAASAAIRPHPAAAPAADSASTAATGAAPRLTVFGVPQNSASVTVPAGKLDGSLTDVAQRYPTLAADHPIRDLHAINPAARFRLSNPLTTPEIAIDAIASGDPQ